jgi:hypothetical protein
MFPNRLECVLVIALVLLPMTSQAAMSSTNFRVPSDSLDGGGGDTSASANFRILDSAGQDAAGDSASANFKAEQGYRVRQIGGLLKVAFVNAGGAEIPAPTFTFGAVNSGPAQNATGTLGIASAKLRITNTRLIAPWSVTMAATAGPTANWTAGANLMDFNSPGATGKLTVNAAAGTIAPQALCSATGLTLGASAAYNQGVLDSITLISAGGGANTNCYWDLTGVSLIQAVPASQAGGNYAISMTITIS